MDTKQISAIPIAAEDFEVNRDEQIKKAVSEASTALANVFNKLCAEFEEKFRSKKWIYLTHEGQSEGVYYVNDIVGLFPDLNVHNCSPAYSYRPITSSDSQIVSPARLQFSGFQGVIPNESEVKRLFNDDVKYFREYDGDIKCLNASSCCGLTYKTSSGYYYMWTRYGTNYKCSRYDSSEQVYFWVIPIFRFNVNYSSAWQIFSLWWQNYLTPRNGEFKTAETRKLFRLIEQKYEFFKITASGIAFDEKKVFDAVKAGQSVEFFSSPDFLSDKTADGGDFEKKLRDELLSCDFKRACLDKYDAKLLTDPSRGHWDLWDLPTDSEHKINLKEKIYARDPVADINAAGIVGIDFGTKSTVVVYENERGEIIPLQVGKGDYSKGVVAENYENPTILEFISIEKFLSDYGGRAGRPKTSWNDVTVSHTAQKNLQNQNNSDFFWSYFTSLKQWCGDILHTQKIRDQKGYEIDLTAFDDISKGEFNPLEYYAYYLGSYINHMLQPKHIFMKYILSFPVMYERNIRDRMLRSFSDGLKKSLPTALLSNETAMKKFQVVEGTTEPAAYAVTALEGYGFLNGEDDQDIYYSVFDFGGGTTDFDFGVLKPAEGDDLDFYDYVLTHFGAHGDRTLGGENLLRLLAFHVFKANRNKLLKPRENSNVKIPFTFAAEKMEFAGSEGLVRSSQEADLNMHNLMDKLRPVWEKPDGEEAQKIFASGKIDTKVFDDSGAEITNFELVIGEQKKSSQKSYSAQNDDVEIPEKIIEKARKRNSVAINKLERFALIGDMRALAILHELVEKYNDKDAIRVLSHLQKNQNSTPQVEEKISESNLPAVDLEKILSDRISRGIENFFISLRDAFDKVSGGEDNGVAPLSDVSEIKIFLAGNSTKSALVKKIFAEFIEGKARKLLGFGKDQDMPNFILYPPLGTVEAEKIQSENGVVVDKNNFARPTGKTGVAFGLLRCRDGSAIRVVDITPEGRDKKQVPFQFYVGRARRGKFQVIIDKAAKLNQWYRFIGAKLGTFDLLYTDESIAATNDAPVSIAKRLTVEISPDAEANVYVMATTSNTIRYAVSKDTPPPEMEGTSITLI